jgi:hypothetical protein
MTEMARLHKDLNLASDSDVDDVTQTVTGEAATTIEWHAMGFVTLTSL